MKKIPLSQGKIAIIDDKDFDLVNEHKWSYTPVGYARTGLFGRKNHIKVYLHRFILNAKDGEIVDHINQDKLDNRRSNLRITTRGLNNLNNFKPRKDNIIGLRGVSFDKKSKKWRARLKHKQIGKFDTPQEASEVYLKALKAIL